MSKPLLPLSVQAQMKTAEPSLLKEMAEYYRIGLDIGLISVPEAMIWIDNTLVSEIEPARALIEASLAGSRGAYAVADELEGVEGSAIREAVAKRLFARMLNLLSSDAEQAGRIAWWLYRMAVEDYAPAPEAKSEMFRLDDALSLAEDGIYYRVTEVTENLRTLLKRYA